MTFQAEDAAGNIGSASFTVSVFNNQAPVIEPIDDVTLEADPDGTVVIGFTGLVEDNVDAAITPVFSLASNVISSPYAFPIGANLISINATDSAGNTAVEEQFTITVTPPPAPPAPVITTAAINGNRSLTIAGTARTGSLVRVTFPDLSFREVTASGGSFTVTSTSDMLGGTVSVTATDGFGSSSVPATVDLFPDYEDPTLTSTLTGPTNAATIPVVVTFSEDVTGFAAGDVTVGTGSISNFSGSGSNYSFDVTPSSDALVTVGVPANVAFDAFGNGNTASSQFSIQYDATPPGLTITGVPDSFLPGDILSVGFVFAETVIGFDTSNITVSGGTLSGFSGNGSSYSATVTPNGDANVTVSVSGGAATDSAGNLSIASSATANIDSTSVVSEQIVGFLQNRARNLVQNQPRLSSFLSGGQAGMFNAQVTRGFADVSIQSSGHGPVWFSLQGSRTEYEDGSGDTVFGLGTIGTHTELHSGFLLGGMLQFDLTEENQGGGVGTSGRGWLAGPYVVTQLENQPLFFEGRLLYGESYNEVSPCGTYTDTFSAERLLAFVAVEGSYEADRLRYFPRLQVSHVAERQLAYTDGLSNVVPEQMVSLTEVSAGIDFEMPILTAESGHLLTWGAAGIWSRVDGDGPASDFIHEAEGGRARIDLGYRYDAGAGLTASADVFADGLGSSSFTTYGIALGMGLQF